MANIAKNIAQQIEKMLAKEGALQRFRIMVENHAKQLNKFDQEAKAYNEKRKKGTGKTDQLSPPEWIGPYNYIGKYHLGTPINPERDLPAFYTLVSACHDRIFPHYRKIITPDILKIHPSIDHIPTFEKSDEINIPLPTVGVIKNLEKKTNEVQRKPDGLAGLFYPSNTVAPHSEWPNLETETRDKIETDLEIAFEYVKADLEALTTPGKTASDKEKPKALHSLDFRSVKWFGTEFTFTSYQAACVKVLWKAWENGTSEVGGDTILLNAECENKRLKDVFKGHPAWGKMIKPGSTKGAYQLIEPTSK